MCDGVNVILPIIYFCLILKLVNKVYNHMSMEALMLSRLGRARDFFNEGVIFFTQDVPLI